MNKKKAICSVLRTIRIHKNITQERIRCETLIDVSKYETGNCCPGLVSFVILCQYLRVHPGDVLDWSEMLERGRIKHTHIILLLAK